MSEKISKVYTREGDGGLTNFYKTGKVSKSHPRVRAMGAIDELISFTSHARELIIGSTCIQSGNVREIISSLLKKITHELFALSGVLACPDSIESGMSNEKTIYLEEWIDKLSKNLPGLSGFVVPGGSLENTSLHICRTVCRRSERNIIHLNQDEKLPSEALAYINRLSDLFFVMARYVSKESGADEDIHNSDLEKM